MHRPHALRHNRRNGRAHHSGCACPYCTLRSPIRERIIALDDGMTLEHAHGDEWVLDAGMRDAESANPADTYASAPLSPVNRIRGIARIITLIARRGR